MFQEIPALFLNMKAFIFYLPPLSAVFCQRCRIFLLTGSLLLYFLFFLSGLLFLSAHPVLPCILQCLFYTVIINVCYKVMPAGSIAKFPVSGSFFCFFQPAVFIRNRWDAAFFIAENIAPAAVTTF